MTADSSYHPKVLIVDDEKNIRRTLRMVLSGKDYTVSDCGSAEEAVRLMQAEPVDVVLLDIKLPSVRPGWAHTISWKNRWTRIAWIWPSRIASRSSAFSGK